MQGHSTAGWLALVLVGALLWPVSCAGNDKPARIDELMALYHEFGQFSGTVLVAERGDVIYQRGFGHANREWDVPNGPDTKFLLASITKTFTAALVMQLVEEGELSLLGTVSDYLPWYRSDVGNRITIHALLTHTSGLPDYFPNLGRDKRFPADPREFVLKYCSEDLEFEPDSEFRYSNSGYYVLGVVIEEVTGLSFEQALHAMILDPLGMDDTGIDDAETILPKRATGYQRAGFMRYDNGGYLDYSVVYAAGAVYSTARDLYLWDRALESDGLFSEESRALMFKPHFSLGEGRSIAYGWTVHVDVEHVPGRELAVVSKDGGLNGFHALMSRYVEDGHLIVLLSNADMTALYDMRGNLAHILYEAPYEMPVQPIAVTLREIISDRGISAAVTHYHDWRNQHSGRFPLQENELNGLGYALLREGRIVEAIEIFKVNTEAFPSSANCYDSLGEAYLASGERDLALESYERALELDPSSVSAIEAVRRLRGQ